ncbi:MAG TPA: SDR family NAD(P)-dependent oxidoreductase [Solirubrobacterales bacterium]|nr:SDR family NAD(P)-dependent oxidoreductase [Solirubrobacterales bacterium]
MGAVIHSAAVLEDAMLESLDPESLERVFTPKAEGAFHLHELTADLDLSQFLLFSSISGLLGNAGQANYAAANTFLDALAISRHAEGLPATSLAWGALGQGTGMGDKLGEAGLERAAHRVRERLGLTPISPEQTLELFDAARGLGEPLAAPAAFDAAVLRAQAQEGMLAAVLRGLVRVPSRRRAETGSLAERLAEIPEAERQAVVLDLVRGHVAAVLGHGSAADVEPERAFRDLGFDSLAAVELRNRLVAVTGLKLPATLVFDYPTAAALAGHLLGDAGTGGVATRTAVRSQASSEDPIAIVGMACRYPGGASSPDRLWQFVAQGGDAIAGFPADRGWDLERLYHPDPDHRGTSYAREGGFVDDAAEFDPAFFGISPREAQAMDPQERLLLEASWGALEDAGIDPVSLRGEPAGVFAGVMFQDYGVGSGSGSGLTSGSISGRVAYTFGLEGPAMTVDTACSSSLVAMHLASQALRGGECTLALAGGVSVFSTPEAFVFFSRQRGLAPDGRCKAFAEAADGTGMSEGVGVLALERLSDAERNGHPILATIRGSAVNQDGASNGITAPHGPSQERVIRQALANAGLDPNEVDAVEAHGTGTTLGDPIEAGALLATYGQERERPLKLGSIKSNIGHAQAAAGVAGVIKMAMAMRAGILPKTLHLGAPSSRVEWGAGEVELLTEPQPWEPNGRPRRAGISSFGASGTNAHVILEEAPAPAADAGAGQGADALAGGDRPVPGPFMLPLSAKGEEALRESASRLATHLQDNPELELGDVAHSLATTRSAFEYRAVAVGEDREQLVSSLRSFAHGEEAPAIATGVAPAEQRVAFLYPGQGSQWQGMALDLLDSSPVFAARMQACEEALSPHLDFSVVDVLRGAKDAPSIDRIEVVQPALFAVMASLTDLWRACGVMPAAVAGHSQGEIAAAYAAGGLTLADAAMLAALRSRLISKLAGQGAMVSLALPATECDPLLERWQGRFELAAINGPSSAIFSGDREALDELLEHCAEREIRAREVPATIPSHSPHVEVLREELLEMLAQLAPQSGDVPFYSTVTGEVLDTAELDAGYWYRNLREPVRFEQVTRRLLADGHRVLVEVSPHPVFALAVRETVEEALSGSEEAAVLGTLRREEGGPGRFALSLAAAHASGAKLDWEALFGGAGAKRVPLPTYPFQRKRYWISSASQSGDPSAIGLSSADHPLLGAAVELAGGEGDGLLFTGRLSLATHPWLADHAVAGTVLLPGTAFVELALKAGSEVGAELLEELTLQAPLILPEQGAVALQLTLGGPDEEGRREISIHSRPDEEEAEWSHHAQGFVSARIPAAPEPLATWPPEGAEPIEVDHLYDRLAEAGFEYGPAFQGLTAAWRDGGAIYAEVSLPEEQAEEARRFAVHPALLDSAGHVTVGLALGGEGEEPSDPVLPFAWSGVHVASQGASALRLRLDPDEGSLTAFGESGSVVLSVGSLVTRPVEPGQLQLPQRRSLYGVEWQDMPLPEVVGSEDDFEIVHFESVAEESANPAEAARANAEAALELAQRWVSGDRDSRLVLVLRKAVAAKDGESPDLALASIWGLLRSAQSEYPGRFALIDTDGSEASSAALPAAIGAEEPQLALREGRSLRPRLARAPQAAGGEAGAAPLDPERSVLITGGTSGLGALVARHLAGAHGARHLLLVSRSGAEAEGATELRAELEKLGAEVRIESCDVADRDQLAKLIDSIDPKHSLGAVIHSAVVLDDGLLASLDRERLERVFAPKVDAAWHLHELTAGLGLSQFLLFSSISGLLGNAGQANYAAANTFLDALAAHRRAEGLSAASLAWGGLGLETGMSTALDDAGQERMARQVRERLGLAPISAAKALDLFDAACGLDESLLAPVAFDAAALRTRSSEGMLPPLLRGLVRVPARHRPEAGSLAGRLAGVPEADREEFVLDLVRGHVAAVLGHGSASEVEPGRAFRDLGFDSLAAVELRNRLVAVTGLSLPATLVFDYPTAAALAGCLLDEVSDGGDATVDDELGQLKLMLAAIPAGDSRRSKLAALLRSLAGDLESSGEKETHDPVADQVESASDDELLNLIDEQVGSVDG